MSTFDVTPNQIEFSYQDLEEAFPNVDPQHAPHGEFVVVQ